MKVFSNNRVVAEAVPEILAEPVASGRSRGRGVTGGVAAHQEHSLAPASAVTGFLRQFRVLVGAARLYQRNHPQVVEIVAAAEQQLRAALLVRSPIVFAVERDGILLPNYDGESGRLLDDPRGELRSLAAELLRSGICSLLFASQTHIGELDALAQQISQAPKAATPADTASRKGWDQWLRDKRIVGIQINVPTERHDSLLLASLVSAVLAHDDGPQQPSRAAERLLTGALTSASFEQVTTALEILQKLSPAAESDARTTPEDVARHIHAILSLSYGSPGEQSAGNRAAVSLIVRAVSCVKPREGETVEAYLKRLGDAVRLAFLRQEYQAGRVNLPELAAFLRRLDQRVHPGRDATGPITIGSAALDESRVAALCQKFWDTLPARTVATILCSQEAWCVPSPLVSRFLEAVATAAEKKKTGAAGRQARMVLSAYARCLESEQGKARRAVATGLTEIAAQIERLWPDAAAADFGPRVVKALLTETSPGIAGLLSAVVEQLARVALAKHAYAEFERLLEALESAPRDNDHAHISMLLERILGEKQWFALVEQALAGLSLHPVIPRLLRRNPERLIDRLGLLLSAEDGMNSLPAMVRLVRTASEPVLGALETRLREPRRQRVVTAIHLLASADPIRLANALPRALPSWEWSLQDLAVSELSRWSNPSVAAATAQAFRSALPEAHALVIPGILDFFGVTQDRAAIPLLLQVATGENPGLRDVYFRIKAVEALGRMQVAESATLLRAIVRNRSGLTHTEPAALRSVAQEALALLERADTPSRPRSPQRHGNPGYARARRYPRAHLKTPLIAAIETRGAARVRTLSLGGAFLQNEARIAVGESIQLEIRTGLRTIRVAAVARTSAPHGMGVEFLHMKPADRERLRRLMKQLLG